MTIIKDTERLKVKGKIRFRLSVKRTSTTVVLEYEYISTTRNNHKKKNNSYSSFYHSGVTRVDPTTSLVNVLNFFLRLVLDYGVVV